MIFHVDSPDSLYRENIMSVDHAFVSLRRAIILQL